MLPQYEGHRKDCASHLYAVGLGKWFMVREKLRDSQWLARDSCELATRKKISYQTDIHATGLGAHKLA